MGRRGRERYLDGTTQVSRVSNTGYRGVIKSIRRGTITLASVGSNTAALSPAVDLNNSVLRFLGWSESSGGSADGFTYLVFTDASTITATRSSATGTVIVSYEVTEYYPGVIKSVQRSTITLAAALTGTAAVSPAVNTAKTQVDCLGFVTDDAVSGNSSNWGIRLTLTSSSLITATSGAAIATQKISYQVVEYY